MLEKIYRTVGIMLFAIVFSFSAFQRFKKPEPYIIQIQQTYQYVLVSMRTFHIYLPFPQQMKQHFIVILYTIAVYECLIAFSFFISNKLAGMMLLGYYLVQLCVQLLVRNTGRGRNFDNIFFRFQIGRYVALVGIAIMLTYEGYKQRKPFQK